MLAALAAAVALISLGLAWPWALARPAGAALGWLVGGVGRLRRGEVEDRLRSAGFADPAGIARGMYASLGAALYELLWTAAPGRRLLTRRVRLTARAEAALTAVATSGAIVATAHTGNWDLVACAVAERRPLWVVSKRLRVRWLDALWQGLRRRRGVRIVDATGAVAATREGLRQGALVAQIIDQVPERASGAMQAPFLGRDAWHDLTPALLAARLRAPLFVALGRRCEDGTHEVDVPLYMDAPDRADAAWAREVTVAMARVLEEHVRAWPSQWLWLHRRWKPRTRGAGARG